MQVRLYISAKNLNIGATTITMKKLLLSWSLIVFALTTSLAQDQIYSQFYAAPIQLNPAFAGNTLAPRVTLNYRSQWPAIDNAYTTVAASYEQFFEPIRSSFGVMLQNDNAGNGIYKQSTFTGVYGYSLQINRDFFIKLGVEAGLTQTNLDWTRLVFPDQLDPIEGGILESNETPVQNVSNVYYDFGVGMLAYGQQFYAGIGLKHINTPNEALLNAADGLAIGLPMRVSIHAGGQFTIQEGNNRKLGSFVSPNLLFVQQGDQGQVNVGAYAGVNQFFGGLWYRQAFSNSDALIFLLGFQYDIFKVGYSYDFTISGLQSINGGSGGANEIFIILNFENSAEFKRRRRSSDYNNCFKIFR